MAVPAQNRPPLRQGTLDNQAPTLPISAEDDGKLLASLDVDTLVECLEIKKLQALKIIQRLP